MELRLGRQCDPVVTLIELAAGYDAVAEREIERLVSQGTLDPIKDAEKILSMRIVDRELRIDAAKAAARYVRPMLAHMAVSGPGGGPIESVTASLPIHDLMQNEEAVRLLEHLQINLAERERGECDAPEAAVA